MLSLSEFFEINHEIILFIYGLVFFILGLAIILQARQSAHLDLARSLRWLAAFGITHAFTEWGDFFIPIQANYLSATLIGLLEILHFILLAISFACLFEFGVTVLRPVGRARWLRVTPIGILLTWAFVVFFILPPISPDVKTWYHTANALARYLIGFPGALLAAYGLRVYTLLHIKQLNVPTIVRAFRIAGFSLGIYAVLAGLIGPETNFFPGNIINSQSFEQVLGAPPLVFRSLVGLIISLAVIRGLEIFDLETKRHIEKLEQQQIIGTEHERLARELHDGAIQKVYTAGLLVESAVRFAKPKSEQLIRLNRAVAVLHDAISDLRQNLAELHDDVPSTVETFPQLLQRLSQDPYYNSFVTIALDSKLQPENTLIPIRSAHCVAIINETLANIVRHAHAKNVRIQAIDTGSHLQIMIQDDGIGFSPDARSGYGLHNMRDRIRLLNGKLDFSSQNNKGMTVNLEIPWID